MYVRSEHPGRKAVERIEGDWETGAFHSNGGTIEVERDGEGKERGKKNGGDKSNKLRGRQQKAFQRREVHR